MHAEWGEVSPRPRRPSTPCAHAGGRIVAVGTTSLRLLETAAPQTADRRLRGRDRHLHHARLPLQGRRPADDQLPSAALDAVHAGGGLRRARPHAGRLRPCHRAGYRFYSYGDACLLHPRGLDRTMQERVTTSPSRSLAHDGRRARRRDHDAARHHPHAGLHAGRHRGHRQGAVPRPGASRRRRHRARQHLSPDAAARRRARRPARRPARLHALGRADPHRLRRLSGDVAVQAAQDHATRACAFQSHIDGSPHMLTPERAVEIQCLLGADIQMQLDECIALPADARGDRARHGAARCAGPSAASARSRSRAARAGAGAVRHRAGRHRCRRCAAARRRRWSAMDFPGYGIGGLAVGEGQELMLDDARR